MDRATEEARLRKDRHFRKYAAAVEKALVPVRAPQQEWADYISFLARLLKTLQAHPNNTPLIPHSPLIALRLAQCMIPSLPSGVHQKALDLYDHIFALLPPAARARDLHLFLPGLLATLTFASLTVRPLFLRLLETHVLSLQPAHVGPALRALLLCLLPGLEDETAEDFDRVLALVGRLRALMRTPGTGTGTDPDTNPDTSTDPAAADSFFWHTFFLAVISGHSRRLGALAYLARSLPPLAATDEIALPPSAAALLSPAPEIFLRCLAAGLADDNPLVQRGFLDLVLKNVPLNSFLIQKKASAADLELLLTTAVRVVLRRDISLNRRLWSWLLGSDPNAPSGADSLTSPSSTDAVHYFSQHARKHLCNGLLQMINSPSDLLPDRVRPIRISISLMDRWEVGSSLIPTLFLPSLESVFLHSQRSDKATTDELVRTASIFFNGVERNLIWGNLFTLIEHALSPGPLPLEKRIHKLKLYKFITTRFNVQDEAMLVHDIPLALLALFARLESLLGAGDTGPVDEHLLVHALPVLDRLSKLLTKKALTPSSPMIWADNQMIDLTGPVILERIQSHYGTAGWNEGDKKPPFNTDLFGPLSNVYALYLLRSTVFKFPHRIVDLSSRVLVTILSKSPPAPQPVQFRVVKFLSGLHSKLANQPGLPNFQLLQSSVDVYTALYSTKTDLSSNSPFAPAFIGPHVNSLWQHLAPDSPRHHVEAVSSICRLESTLPHDRFVEATISGIVSRSKSDQLLGSPSVDAATRFTVLWNKGVWIATKAGKGNHSRSSSAVTDLLAQPGPDAPDRYAPFKAIVSRPLLLFLETLAAPDSEVAEYVASWIKDLDHFSVLISILTEPLKTLLADSKMTQRTLPFDQKIALYYLRLIKNVLSIASDANWASIAPPPSHHDRNPDKHSGDLSGSGLALLADISHRAFALTVSEQREGAVELQSHSLHLLHLIFQRPEAESLMAKKIDFALLFSLEDTAANLPATVQAALLQALMVMLGRRFAPRPMPTPSYASSRRKSVGTVRSMARNSITSLEQPVNDADLAKQKQEVVITARNWLKQGFTSKSSRPLLGQWIQFLHQLLPLFEPAAVDELMSISQLVVKEIQSSIVLLQTEFKSSETGFTFPVSESSLEFILNTLESLLSLSHRLMVEQENRELAAKTPDQTPGFFGNVVGVFSPDQQVAQKLGSARMAVLLGFGDACQLCYSIYAWGSDGISKRSCDSLTARSFQQFFWRVQNRAQRLLEHLLGLEPLGCLEAFVAIACESSADRFPATIPNIFGDLMGFQPSRTVPLLFDSIYSRTMPTLLADRAKSSETSTVNELQIIAFLIEYATSVESDAVVEIWADCVTFFKNILAHPMPHRSILPAVLKFAAVLFEKKEDISFGEDKHICAELPDLFMRLMTALFTTRPVGSVIDNDFDQAEPAWAAVSTDLMTVLNYIAVDLDGMYSDDDRLATAVGAISNSVIFQIVHAKSFPDSLTETAQEFLLRVVSLGQAAKVWKKDVAEILNDNRILLMRPILVKTHWLPILRQYCVHERTVLVDLLGRIPPPATSGLVFGVGATSARLEADKRTQLLLRRITLCLLACSVDTFSSNAVTVVDKLAELATATPTTAPSSATRSDIFLVLRALVLRVSSQYLADLWPFLNEELPQALFSLTSPASPVSDDPDEAAPGETYDGLAAIQACKLLDTLLLLSPDDFQPHQWLFVSDTMAAVYRPRGWTPDSVVDRVAAAASVGRPVSSSQPGTVALASRQLDRTPVVTVNGLRLRRPFLHPNPSVLAPPSAAAHSGDLADRPDARLARPGRTARSARSARPTSDPPTAATARTQSASTPGSASHSPRPSGAAAARATSRSRRGGRTALSQSGAGSPQQQHASAAAAAAARAAVAWRQLPRAELGYHLLVPFLRDVTMLAYELSACDVLEPDLGACADGILEDVLLDPLVGGGSSGANGGGGGAGEGPAHQQPAGYVTSNGSG